MSIWVCLESLAAHWAITDPPMAGQILGYLEQHQIGHAGVAKRRVRALHALAEAGADAALQRGRKLTRVELLGKVRARLAPGRAEMA